jgi:SAM-dependent methyltransferase
MEYRRSAHDVAFDCVYPAAIRLLSRRFWTPVEVARRAAEMFVAAGARRVLDVGSGVGKFVLAAAAAAPAVEFVGVERRQWLVAVARKAQGDLGIHNARFVPGDALYLDWGTFDGLYFFNPLAENLFEPLERIDEGVGLGAVRFLQDVRGVENALETLRLGTAMVTYHGAGTRIPACFELAASEPAGSDALRLWVKRRESVDGEYVLEEPVDTRSSEPPSVNSARAGLCTAESAGPLQPGPANRRR